MLKNPVKLLTRKIRTHQALSFIPKGEVHVDIGCGLEKYLLSKSPCRIKIGFDKKIGNVLVDKIDIEDNSVDCVTMLAVIEHLEYPSQIIKECFRILKKDGVLIITTPKAKSEWVIKLYSSEFRKNPAEHKCYYNYRSMRELLNGYFSILVYRGFLLGLNQLFVCNKINHAGNV